MDRTKLKCEITAVLFLRDKTNQKLVVKEHIPMQSLRKVQSSIAKETGEYFLRLLHTMGLDAMVFVSMFSLHLEFDTYVAPRLVRKLVSYVQHFVTRYRYEDMPFVLDDVRFIVDRAKSVAQMRVKTFPSKCGQVKLDDPILRDMQWNMWADEETSISIRNNEEPIPHETERVTDETLIYFTWATDDVMPMTLYSRNGWTVGDVIRAIQEIITLNYEQELGSDILEDDSEIGSIDVLHFNERTKEVSVDLTFD